MRYLSEISATIRDYHAKSERQAKAVRENFHVQQTIELLCKKEGEDIRQGCGSSQIGSRCNGDNNRQGDGK